MKADCGSAAGEIPALACARERRATFDFGRVHLDAAGAHPHRVSGECRQRKTGLADSVFEAESRPVTRADEHRAVELAAREACVVVRTDAGEGVQRLAATHDDDGVFTNADLGDRFVAQRCVGEDVVPAGGGCRRIVWHERNATIAVGAGAMPGVG